MKGKKGEIKRFKISILVKMLVGIGLPVLAVFIVSFFVILNTAQKPVSSLTDDVLTAKSQTAAAEVGEFFTRYLEVAKQMAANSEFEKLLENTPKGQKLINTSGFDGILKTMVNVQKTDTENILAVWTADFDSSQYTQSDNQSSDDSYDVTTRQWYKDVHAANAAIVTAPYVDAASKKIIVSAVSPVFNSDTEEMIGVTCIDFSIDKLQAMMKTYTMGDTGFFILLAADGTVIYYPDSQYLEKNFADTNLSDNIKTAVVNKQTGDITYIALGNTVHGYLSVDKNTGFTVISGLPESEYAGTVNTLRSTIDSIFITAAVILLVLIALVSISIIHPIKKLKYAANEIAEGRFDVVVSTNSHDEVGQVSEALGRTVDRLCDYINYINEVSTVLNQIADGNLMFELVHDYSGEFEKIKTSMLRIQSTLSEHVGQITTAAEQVASGSSLVSDSSLALSQGATEQASAIQQLTASIQEVGAQTSKNAENAGKVDEIARSAKADAAGGNARMNDMLFAMEDINESSSKISKIIKVIDDIAFQTNILALNAAVEAARAGQHGKGFAVVAEEVRNLAARSANAAKETAELIENSIIKVGAGTKIAKETADSLVKIVDEVDKVAELVATITTASQAQAGSIEQINIGVSQVSQVIQTNAATAEESAAASEELSAQAEQLKHTVSVFKVKGGKIKSNNTPYVDRGGLPTGSTKKPYIALNGGDFGKY